MTYIFSVMKELFLLLSRLEKNATMYCGETAGTDHRDIRITLSCPEHAEC
jgi:hypothetical protein